MPDPNNYAGTFANVPSPIDSLASGYQIGAGIRNDQFAQQQQQVLLAQQQRAQALMARAMQPGATADDHAAAMMANPQSAEALSKAWAVKNPAQQQAAASQMLQIGSAITNGQPEVAADILNKQADAIENQAGGPTPASQAARAQAQVVKTHPEFALGLIQATLAANPSGQTAATALATYQDQRRKDKMLPAELTKAGADAQSAVADAAVKTATVPALAAKPALDNQKLQEDTLSVAAQRQVAQMDLQIKQANSQTEKDRLQLERDKYVQEQAKLGQTQGQAAQDAQNQTTAALQTVGEIKNHPSMDDFFTGPGTKWGAIWRVMPGSNRQALETHIDALKGQLGYSNLMAAKAASPTGASGFGALSDGELRLLSNLAGNLDPNSADFPQQLSRVERFLQKAQSTAIANPNLPNSGGAFVTNHPAWGLVDEGRINKWMREHPGSTREQTIQFLQATGGK